MFIIILLCAFLGAIIGLLTTASFAGLWFGAGFGALLVAIWALTRGDPIPLKPRTQTFHICVDNFALYKEDGRPGLVNKPLPLTVTHADTFEADGFTYIRGAEGTFRRPAYYATGSKNGWERRSEEDWPEYQSAAPPLSAG